MKKIVMSLGVLSFALLFVLVSCEPRKPEGLSSSVTPVAKDTAPAPAPERSYILVSQLAFKGYLSEKSAKIPEAKALYEVAQNDSRELAGLSQIKNEKTQFIMMRKTVDLCPCSTGSGLCPCPGDTTAVALAAKSYNEVNVKFDEKALKEDAMKNEGDNSWVTFKWPEDMKDGKHMLTISGKFTEGPAKTYRVPVEVKDGKFYLKWE